MTIDIENAITIDADTFGTVEAWFKGVRLESHFGPDAFLETVAHLERVRPDEWEIRIDRPGMNALIIKQNYLPA